MANDTTTGRIRFLPAMQVVALAIAVLYFARPVLMPLALAVLFTFLLKPVVGAIERRGLKRPVAVGMVVMVIVLSFSLIGWQVGIQLTALAESLPGYRVHLREKLVDLRGSGKVFKQIRETVEEANAEVKGNAAAESIKSAVKDIKTKADQIEKRATALPEQEPQTVRVVAADDSPLDIIKGIASSFGEIAGTTAVIVVLVIFMLIEYEEVRNRLVRLAGTRRLTLTTKTLDEVGRRIGSYLLMNAIVNSGFGLAIWLGLQLIGVEYAPLWGMSGAVLRFVPYIGPLVAFVMPFLMAVLQYTGWMHPALVVALFVGVELVTNTVIEPLTYGKSAGVSTVALLVSAMFWTWVWGPMGLILSVPMTVVFAVMGKYIPHLEPLQILLGDTPALAPYAGYYQRLLAGDLDEAADILEEAYKSQPLVEVYDGFVIPALALAERDELQGELTAAEKETVWKTTRNLIEENASARLVISDAADLAESAKNPSPADSLPRTLAVHLVGCPAFDQADELALTMLQHLMPRDIELRVMPVALMASEVLAAFTQRLPDAVWISALGPGGVGQTRYLCKRIQQSFPKVRIFVGRWGFQGDREQMIASLKARGASQVVTTLAEACGHIERIHAVQEAPALIPAQAVPVVDVKAGSRMAAVAIGDTVEFSPPPQPR